MVSVDGHNVSLGSVSAADGVGNGESAGNTQVNVTDMQPSFMNT